MGDRYRIQVEFEFPTLLEWLIVSGILLVMGVLVYQFWGCAILIGG